MSNLHPGEMLGPYQIISQIGQGGMATVYKAYHANMDRYVALKVLSHQFAQNEEFLGRFQHEARLIAKLEHPHILPVHDFGESQGTPYLVMRYLDAGTLKDKMERETLTLQEIDHILTQLADALAYAHEKGVIHRDLKPSNAMLDQRGDVFLTDFGIAKMLEGSPHFTLTGAITGTPAYMSPEQAQGLKLDQRSDIYSLGIVLYEMMTGRVPFEAETPLAVILKHIQDPLPPISSIKPDTHPAVEAVLLKSLAKKPEDRFQTTRKFLQAWKNAMRVVQENQEHATSVMPPVTTVMPPPPQGVVLEHKPATVAPKPMPKVQPASMAHPSSIYPSTPVVRPTPHRIQQPVKRSIPLGCVIAAGTMLILSLIGVIIIGGLYVFRPKPVVTQSGGVTISDTLKETSWQSWVSANAVHSIAVRGEEVITGGPGGITIYDLADGSISRLTTQEGLPSAYVNAVYVDEDNSLWVGTDNGLAHLDRQNQIISVGEMEQYFITAITRIGHDLWVGTNYTDIKGTGLYRFNGQEWITELDFPSEGFSNAEVKSGYVSTNVSQILADSYGDIWVSTWSGVAHYDGERWITYDTDSGLPDLEVTAMMVDEDGVLWVGTSLGNLGKFNGKSFEFMENLNTYNIYGIYAMLQDEQGVFWFCGDIGIASYDPRRNSWVTYENESGQLLDSTITSAAMNETGILFFGTPSNGLVRYDGKFSNIRMPNVPNGFYYTSILKVPTGDLWFIDEYNGSIDNFSPSDQNWSAITFADMCCPIPMNWDPQGRMWAGGYDGVWIFNGNNVHMITTNEGLPSNYVLSIAFTQDNLAWIGTDEGLAVYNILEDQIIDVLDANNQLEGSTVFVLFSSRDGTLWVGTESGVSRRSVDGTWAQFRKGKSFADSLEFIADFAEDATNTIWTSASGDGIYRFNGKDWEAVTISLENQATFDPYIGTLAFAPDGSLWIGTYGEGAARFYNDKWTTYTTSDGLIDNTIFDIYAADEQDVWFATPGGITHLQNP
jgi:serine/threonine protein kinase/ligand-binding sensor domain-containing protein